MAVANSLAAVRAGARQVECTINGIGERAGNAALEEVVMALQTRRDCFERRRRVDTTQIYPTQPSSSARLTGMPCQPNKAIVGANAFAHESGIHQDGVLSSSIDLRDHDARVDRAVGEPARPGQALGPPRLQGPAQELGYALTKEELDRTFARFKDLADKKKKISDWDIEALVMKEYWNSPEGFRLERFIINCGNTITSTANVELGRNGESTEEVAQGDGPIDAAFKAIEKIVGESFTLEDFALRSVTSGNDAQAGVSLKLRRGERMVLGKGLSTDVVEAGILAFINAVNRFLEEEKPTGH